MAVNGALTVYIDLLFFSADWYAYALLGKVVPEPRVNRELYLNFFGSYNLISDKNALRYALADNLGPTRLSKQ